MEALKQQADSGAVGVNEDNVDSIIKVPEPVSEKIVHLVAKHHALEDCMAAVKKGFEKDAVDIKSFLKEIRNLAKKQCKQIQKMKKIEAAMGEGAQSF